MRCSRMDTADGASWKPQRSPADPQPSSASALAARKPQFREADAQVAVAQARQGPKRPVGILGRCRRRTWTSRARRPACPRARPLQRARQDKRAGARADARAGSGPVPCPRRQGDHDRSILRPRARACRPGAHSRARLSRLVDRSALVGMRASAGHCRFEPRASARKARRQMAAPDEFGQHLPRIGTRPLTRRNAEVSGPICVSARVRPER
jgi:hypothetical protein